MPSMRGVRTACLRTQLQANEPRLGGRVPRRPARGDAYRFHPVAKEASTEAGPGPSPFQSRPGCDLPHASRFGRGGTEFRVIAQVPISATVIGILARNCVLGCLGCWSQVVRIGVPSLCQVTGWEARSRSSLELL